MKIILITKKLDVSPSGGRELLCKLNHDSLKKIYGEKLVIYELIHTSPRSINDYLNIFRGYIDGVNKKTIRDLIDTIECEKFNQVFVDGSNLGGLIKPLKKIKSTIEVTTFFHNVEVKFFLGATRKNKSLHSIGVLAANYLAERKSVKFSDNLICLSKRDSKLLKKLYGKEATHIAPMVLEDKCPSYFLRETKRTPEKFAIFVGGLFYANRAGIKWFVREVVPRIDLPLYIIGRGFDALREELEIPGKVTVVGSVDSLADWYRRAQFVIAPIFDGSGMKTKVAEALMYGKKIIGTPEAFSGYEDVVMHAGWVCKTSDDFVEAVSVASIEVTESFDKQLRILYEQRYSEIAATQRLKKILS